MKRFLPLTVALGLFSTAASAAPVVYTIDPTHTNVIASWNHLGFSNPFANFGNADGRIVYDADDVAKSSVEVTLPLSGLNTFTGKLDDHLRGPEFFDAVAHPAITFKSTRVESAAGGRLKVTGDLTVKGVTRPVTMMATLNKAGQHPMKKVPAIGFDAQAMLKRSDFGISAYTPNVGDEVKLQITTEATAAADKAG